MRYTELRWHHDFDDEPVRIYSEIEFGEEVRKVEVFRDGRHDLAEHSRQTGSTDLATILMPPVEDFPGDAELELRELDAASFERVWAEAERQAPYSLTTKCPRQDSNL